MDRRLIAQVLFEIESQPLLNSSTDAEYHVFGPMPFKPFKELKVANLCAVYGRYVNILIFQGNAFCS